MLLDICHRVQVYFPDLRLVPNGLMFIWIIVCKKSNSAVSSLGPEIFITRFKEQASLQPSSYSLGHKEN